ncbi:hypothetical protein QYE76_032548 [Lolium multiflorum]|uniref:Reverse transcriptase domain-containing protein n=1 Tax=Lolium multiflorum TaxID=4521 RepID=A0AAD8QUY6_LOLMU|nr:hypothetical protein QYE76_032548 [Lolium multiflorum]
MHGASAATSANLAEIIAKQQEDHQSVLATLTGLVDENHQARVERTEDRATLQSIAETLQKLQGDIADTVQQQRAHNLALLRLKRKGAPQLGDPRPWLKRCNLFFLGQRTQESDKTWLASYHLTDVAALWYGHLEAKLGQRPSWGEFQTLISNHFGPPTRANPFGELISTRRTGTVADYSKRFLENLSRIQPIADAEERDIFTNNLGEPMKTQVEMLKPSTLDAAMDLDISFEHLNIVTGAATTAARPIRPSRTAASPTLAAQESVGSAPALVFKKLTPAEMDDRRAKVLCFNCDEKFVRGDRCKRLFYIQSADDDEEPLADGQEEAKISLLAVTGIPTSDTMQVAICIGDRDLVALLDSGSTHNFIHEGLATVVGLPFSSDRRLGVTVANGDRVTCRGLLKQAAITIDTENFLVDLHAIPLGGFDVVLGLGSSGRPAHIHVCEGRALLDSLLAAFSDVFAEPQGLPPPRAHDHHIHLIPGTQPVAIRPYRYPAIQKDELERQCAEMLARGLIRQSSSAFSSPVLLVRKHDGTWRFCIDFRGLNMVTIKDKFPIPVVDELLDELKGARFFTKLDLRSGYHQVRMAPEDIHKTAFRTHEGLFEFVVMAFGLTNAPATFQALMNDVLGPFLRRFVLVFFDDILIYSSSWSDHLRHVKLVLEAMRTHQLYLKRSKCSFGEESMAYLGHVIFAEGVAMDSDKVLAVVDWPAPRTVRAVRGFLGLAGYYRKFIKGFGTIAAPLTALLKKDGFLWTDQAATAFEALKVALTTAPVLQLPDFTAPFIVECDASGSGFGAVMHQGEGPIAYFSKPIAPRHVSLAAYERELIGLVQAVRHWRPYLWGRAFIVKTDHYSLKFLLDQRLATIPQHHWVGKLLGFDFTVEYKPGRQNIVADALSRREVATGHTCAITGTSFDLFEALRQAAHTDPTSVAFQEQRESGELGQPWALVDGIVTFQQWAYVPPSSPLVGEVLEAAHDDGHEGI